MTCAEIQADLSLYLYGELDFAAEEFIETHLASCAFCQLALNREKEWHAAVNKGQQDVAPEFLGACRADLLRQISQEPTTAAQARHRIAVWLQRVFDLRVTERSYRLAAASFLVLLGFAAGRLLHSFPGWRVGVECRWIHSTRPDTGARHCAAAGWPGAADSAARAGE